MFAQVTTASVSPLHHISSCGVGQVVVFAGLFEATPNMDALASVIGHEVGHVVANHGGEKLSKVCCIRFAI